MAEPVPPADSVAPVEGLGAPGRLRILRSDWGHDVLKDTDRIDAILRAAGADSVGRRVNR